MKLFLFLAVFGFVTSSNLDAQHRFSGKLVDLYSRQELPNATVRLSSGKIELTGTDGVFVVEDTSIQPEVYITAIGYSGKFVQLQKDSDNILGLQPAVTDLKEIRLETSTTSSRFSTLSKIDLNLRPVKSAQDLLRLAPGLFVAQHAGGGKAEQIFLRGFDVDHGTDVSVNVDGMPVNMVSHAHGQGYADAHFIIPETVHNFDFGAGPYYAAYGNFTTAGFINMTTYNSIDKSRIQVEAGRFNTYRTLVMLDLLKKNKDKQSAYLAADYNYSDGPTKAKQHFNRYNLFAKYNLAISKNTQLTASASSFFSAWDASGQIPERMVESGNLDRFGSIDPTEGGSTTRHNLNIILNSHLNNNLRLESQMYYSRYKFNLYSNFTFFLEDSVNGDGIQQKETRDLVGLSSKLTKRNRIGQWQLSTSLAIGSRLDFTQGSALNKQAKRAFIGQIKFGNISEANYYTYLNQQISHGKFVLDWSLRADYFTHQYSSLLNEPEYNPVQNIIVSPKINLQYNRSPALQLYAKAGKGFHSNDSRVVVLSEERQALPAAYGTDLGAILKPNKKLLLNIAFWHLYLQQEFVYVGDAGIVEPSGKTKRMGIDIVARYQLTKNIFANTNINITKARAIAEPKGANYIPLAPDVTSTGGIFYRQNEGWNAGISYRHIGNRAANEDNSIIAKGYFLLDGSVQYSKSGFEYGLVFENILNTKWNEAQFATESRLQNENSSVNELHFTPGNPFFVKARFAVSF